MASILDAFILREFLNLKELLAIIINEKTPKYFLNSVSIDRIYLLIIEMIKLGYIEIYKGEETLIPIFQITELGVTTLQQRTLQNLALPVFIVIKRISWIKKRYR